MTSSLVYIPLTPCVKKTLGCCNRLADDARAAGEFQERQYCDAYVLLAQLCEETNALLAVITQKFNRGGDGKCTVCAKAEGEHYSSNGNKYCYVSTTSPCLPPHTYGFVLLSDACLFVS